MASSVTASSQAGPFVIKVLEGPMSTSQLMGGVPAGQIWLRDRSLPYRPISFKGKQRVKTTWLPGNPSATQQVMGPTEEPTTITGKWKDKFLGNGVARQLANLFTDIRRTGPLVEVSWGSGIIDDAPLGPGIVRRGIITDSEFIYERPQDVEFKIEFTWRGDDQPVAPAVLAIGVENPRQGFANVTQSLQDMVDDYVGFQDSPLNSLVRFPGELQQEINATLDQVTAVQDLITEGTGLGVTLTQLPQVTAVRAIQVGLAAAQTALDLRDAVESLNPLQVVAFDSALDFLIFQNQQFSVMKSADTAQFTSVSTVNSLTGQIQPTVIAEVRPVPGTDLRDLALKYYGDPDLWPIIAQYNGLDSSKVSSPPTGPSDDPAPAIQIPKRVTGALGQLSC